MNQFQSNTKNYVVRNDMTLGESRTENTIYPQGCKEGRNPVMKGDENTPVSYEVEHKVGDHME